MLLKNLFKPKWQHKNPEVRRQAMQALNAQDAAARAILRDLALQDPVVEVRSLALRRLDELDLWVGVARQEADAGLRELAWTRICEHVAGKGGASLPLESRRVYLDTLADERLSEFVLRQGVEPVLRRAALARIGRESVCAERVLSDPDPELRLEALAKVEQRATLERLLKGVRTKDKRIAAAIKERLEALREIEEWPQRLRQQGVVWCGRMEALRERTRVRPDWEVIQREFAATEAHWQAWLAQWAAAQPGGPDEALMQRYTQARERLAMALRAWEDEAAQRRAQEAQYAPARAERQALLETATRLLNELQQNLTPTDSDVAHGKRAIAVLRDSWQVADALPPQERAALEQQFQDLIAAVQAQVDDIARYRDAEAAWPALLERATLMLSAPADEAALRALAVQCAAVPVSVQRPSPSAAAAVQPLLEVLHQRAAEERNQRRARIEDTRALAKQLDAALDAGQVQDAERLYKRMQEQLAGVNEPALLHRIQQAVGRLRELRDWRGWGNVAAKEQLCAEAEALLADAQTHAEGGTDWAAMAQRIKQMQEQWKKLGPAHGEKALWERFHAACTAAYAPCRDHFAAQASERAANLAHRQALCAQLEALAPAGEDTVWNVLESERALREVAAQWQRSGAVEGRQMPAINTRYRAAQECVRAAIKAEKTRHQASKHALVGRIETLVQGVGQGGDLRAAIEQAKAAQTEWKAIGPALDERVLWNAFRAACDALFAQRQQAVEAQQREYAAQRALRLELCERLERMTADDISALRRVLDQIQMQWRGLGALSKQDGHALETRFRAACTRVEQTCRAAIEAQRVDASAQFRRKAAACLELERCAAEVTAGTLPVAQALLFTQEAAARWAQLPLLDTEPERILQQRYQRAVTWVQRLAGGDTAVATQIDAVGRESQQAKEELCLRMEILAGVDSPPQMREARMAYQVAQLAQRLGAGAPHASKPDDAAALQQLWSLTGLAKAGDTDLEQRFAAALAATSRA